jgi:hypothetical protein
MILDLPKLGLTFVLVVMVVSSPILLVGNSALAAKSKPLPTINSIPSLPSTIGQDGKGGDLTTQAALGSLTARPTNNIVNTNSFYDVVFLTATSGTIKKIEVTFPSGTTVPTNAYFNEAEKCVPNGSCTVLTGSLSKNGQTIIYSINNPVSVPVNTKFRLEFANINNPLNPGSSFTVTVTTRNAANAIIDGPTQSTAYTIKQIGSNVIADNSITTPKIADGAVTADKLDLSTDPIAFSMSSQTAVSLMNPISPTSTFIRVAGSDPGITTFTENGILDGIDGQYLILYALSDTNQIRIMNGANIISPQASITLCCLGAYEFIFDADASAWRFIGYTND